MKLPDSEPLTPSEYWIINDTWKQDWERGVQVPVNPDALPAPKVKIIANPKPPNFQEFKLPKNKYIHLTRDVHYQSDQHLLSSTPAKAEAACTYDLDSSDTSWLKLLNAERARAGAPSVSEDQLEKVIEELEVRTWDKIQAIIKSEEGLGIEYDENVICDVCRSPDSEDGNEMVFCDSCNICVHQACYGITVIPDGQWMCRPCGATIRPTCVLCPNIGGAMKCTPSGHKWAHVSCVLWIPEVSIGCAEKMEPITKITSIPASRWSLVCVLCRERKGACIQCSVKTCKTAYHVTCAFKHGLEMRAIIEDENADDGVKLRSYCQKHSVNSKKEKGSGSGSEEEEVKKKRRKDMTSEEKTQARAARLQEIEGEFDRHVTVKDISTHLLDIDQDAIHYIYNYWKLKRRAGHNRPLLPPKSDDHELLSHRQEQADLDKMKMFVQLRQDLERVRNLCYMVSRREKLSRTFFRMREQTFHKQIAVINEDPTIAGPDLAAIIEANHGPSIYDRLYSHPNAPDHKNDFEDLLARIAPQNSSDDKKKDRNGLVRGSKSTNPYKKHYVNGSRRSGSMFSGYSSEESGGDIGRSSKCRGRAIGSTTEDDVKKTVSSPKKKVSPKGKGKKSPKKVERKKRKIPQSKAVVESSSEDDTIKCRMKKDRSCSKTLQQLEKEMTAGKTGQSGTESDDLIIRTTRNSKFPMDIYSDSSDDVSIKEEIKPGKSTKGKNEKSKSEKTKAGKSSNENDSQQPLPRTKAAMKEFIPEKKTVPVVDKPAPKKRGRKPSNKTPVKIKPVDTEAKNKENIKSSKQKDNPTDLIVPQRQAAKKASENMRSTTAVKKEDSNTDKQVSGDDSKFKPKLKSKGKEAKDILQRVGRKKLSKGQDKEVIAYVPQRQAAKKAAAHIKSGLGSKTPATETVDTDKKKEIEKTDTKPKKEDSKRSKSPEKESSSSSSNSSSSSYSSSSSSEEEQEKPEIRPTAKAREIKPAPRQPSMFSPPGSRPTVDLPFLDKVSRPLSSTSASSDSDSSKASRFSGSGSPSPQRPRRRRKRKSDSVDASLRKAPDKKLKTSDQGSECRVPSPAIEGEEPSRPSDTRASTRARTRSTTSSGNMPHKSDTQQRKPSKDDTEHASTPNKISKAGSQPIELTATKRKEDAEVKKESAFIPPVEVTNSDIKIVKPIKPKGRSVSIEEKVKPHTSETTPLKRTSPRKSTDSKLKISATRRMSVKDPPTKVEILSPKDCSQIPKQINSSRRNTHVAGFASVSPVKKAVASIEVPPVEISESKPVNEEVEFPDNDKNWLPKAPSPNVQPPPVEKLGDHEKYMTEDKSFDSDCTDKSSIKMIAKIQANLNENTMIKSPKTPMDARTIDPMDVEAIGRNTRKRSNIDVDKKFITQDSSHVQGVEISKSATIPSTTNPFPNKSVFSPNKDTELFEFDHMLAVDDEFNNEEIMKPFTYPEFFFKEDSKEQGVQETLNLVDRLRMQLNTKKVPIENSSQDDGGNIEKMKDEDAPITHNVEKTDQDILGTKSDVLHVNDKMESTNDIQPTNHFSDSCHDAPHDAISENKEATLSSNSNDVGLVDLSQNESHIEPAYETKYDIPEEIKEPATVQSINSVSEIGDTISLSKQSDDSQSLSVVDHSLHSNDQELTQDIHNENYDNNNSMILSNCAAVSSPYIGHRESKITTRRSSASSTNSEGSVCSQKTDVKCHLNCESLQGTLIPEIDAYPLPAYSCRVEPTMPLNQYTTYPRDVSPFLSSMGTLPIFGPGPCASSQLTLPSPASGIFSSGLPYSVSPLIPPPPFTLCAAFTTSSQNIALTTAMIASPTRRQLDSPQDDIDVTGSDQLSIHVASSPSISVDSYNESSNPRAPTKMSSDSNDTVMSQTPQETSSPKAAAKTVAKFSGKSPGKSPGISPRQNDTSKGTKRSNNKNNRSQRGRGRSKSRGQGNQSGDFTGNSIQSKLVGTVYDFDEEIANDGVDLKALRERRKSVDSKDDRKSEHSYHDSSQSPRAISPYPASKKPTVEPKDMKPSTPEPAEEPQSPLSKNNSDRETGFTQVQPVLPGPVDMRTYNNQFENPAPVANVACHSHLMAFASGTADQHLVEFDEELEKKLHSALMASKPKTGTPAEAGAQELVGPSKETFTPHLPKVSLSDSRNQLKVKIKGPFLDANYSTSSVQPVVPQPPPPAHESTTSAFNSSTMAGSTNLRRMRKKELLRQYWTQDMNMDDPSNLSTVSIAPPPAAPQPMLRAVITIPKAVASMTSIPTREDYKIIDTPVEKKKRKTDGLSRELRQLAVGTNDDIDPSDDVKLSHFAGSSSQKYKRRGRLSTKPYQSSTTPAAPKLKIKFGSNIIPQVNEEPSAFQLRPPKKRLQSIPKPSLKDLKRESMKYRRLVMANFEEDEKANTPKHKPTKTEKRKKKKDKKSGKEKLQVINRESESATKLIIKKIKIKCTKEGKGKLLNSGGGTIAGAVAAAPEPPVDPLDYDPTKPDPLAFDSPLRSECASTLRRIRTDKVTPIRLKRSPQGSGYVMEAGADIARTSASLASTASTSTASTSASVSFAVNKHCEVR